MDALLTVSVLETMLGRLRQPHAMQRDSIGLREIKEAARRCGDHPRIHHSAGSAMKVLIPIDDSDSSRRATEQAARLAATDAGAMEVILLNVRNDPEYRGELSPLDYQALDRAQREAQQKLLARSLEHAHRIGLTRASVEAAQGLAADEIVRVAQERGVDQIVMGTHGRGAVGRLFLGSVAQRVIHLATMPVTVVK